MWEKIWEFIVNSSKPIISTIIVILAVVLINIILRFSVGGFIKRNKDKRKNARTLKRSEVYKNRLGSGI